MNRIAELKKSRAGLYKRMEAFLIEKDGDDGMSADDAVSFGDMKSQLDALDQRIARLEELVERAPEDSDEVKSKDDGDEDDDNEDKSRKSFGRSNVLIKSRTRKDGLALSRFIIGAGILAKSGSTQAGRNYIAHDLGDVTTAKALASNVQATGGALVPAELVEQLIDLRGSNCVVRKAGVQTVPMPLGNLTYPVLTGAAGTSWIGENQDAAISQPSYGDLQLSAKKLAGIVPVSMDLIRRSPLSVEQIVTNNLGASLARAEDAQLLTGTPSLYKPNSIFSMALAAQTHTATVAGLSDINNLLRTMVLDVEMGNIDTAGARWIFHPSFKSYLETLTDNNGNYFFAPMLAAGNLLGFEFSTSTQLATNLGTSTKDTLVMFTQPSELILADTLNVIADSTTQASYNDGANVISPYQRDQMLFRVITEIDFAVAHPQAISVAQVTGAHPSFYSAFGPGSAFVAGNTSSTGSASKAVNPSGS